MKMIGTNNQFSPIEVFFRSILLVILFCLTEPVEPPPRTYTTKEKFEYFKPTVQVEMDNPDKEDTVTQIYIRGEK